MSLVKHRRTDRQTDIYCTVKQTDRQKDGGGTKGLTLRTDLHVGVFDSALLLAFVVAHCETFSLVEFKV